MGYCRNCGKPIPEGAGYCPNCGTAVASPKTGSGLSPSAVRQLSTIGFVMAFFPVTWGLSFPFALIAELSDESPKRVDSKQARAAFITLGIGFLLVVVAAIVCGHFHLLWLPFGWYHSWRMMV